MLKITLKLTGIIGLVAALAAPVFADEIPKKSPVGRYAKLWVKSPFTEKPPPVEGPEKISLLDDYTLAGVSPVEGGYSVILINKKKRDDRIHLMPGMTTGEHGFTVVSVRQDPISTKNTTVEIKMADGTVDRVGKEEKFLALKTAPGTKKPPKKPVAKPHIPGLNTGAKPKPTTGRAPRVRRVPTPPKK